MMTHPITIMATQLIRIARTGAHTGRHMVQVDRTGTAHIGPSYGSSYGSSRSNGGTYGPSYGSHRPNGGTYGPSYGSSRPNENQAPPGNENPPSMSDEELDARAVLGIDPDTTITRAVLNSAYHEAARKCHSDRHRIKPKDKQKENKEEFKKVNNANKFLKERYNLY